MTETTILKDVPYGAHERNILDLYIPHSPKNASALILFIHGGGWTACDKSVHEPDAQYWSGRGYICCTMNYRYVDAHTKENFHTAAAQTALAKISPIAYVSNASIPVAICHGLRDDVVPYSQSVRFLKCLVERGVPHDLITYENSDHMLQNDPDAAEQARQRMQLYLENYFDTDKLTM